MRKQKGFSLIELLIVIAIILIIAAIAIPNLLQARISANESSAAGTLHTLQTAEISYAAAYSTIGYAVSITQLGGPAPCTPSSVTACIIDNFLATATPGSTGKSGYYYLATGIAVGAATDNAAYVVAAAPIGVNTTGNRDFCSTDDVILRSQVATAGDVPVNTTVACVAFPLAP